MYAGKKNCFHHHNIFIINNDIIISIKFTEIVSVRQRIAKGKGHFDLENNFKK